MVVSWVSRMTAQIGERAFATVRKAAGEGIEEIGAEPLREGHVPVVPELGQVGLEVGGVEVLRQADAEQAPEPDGDIGVAAEIEDRSARHRHTAAATSSQPCWICAALLAFSATSARLSARANFLNSPTPGAAAAASQISRQGQPGRLADP